MMDGCDAMDLIYTHITWGDILLVGGWIYRWEVRTYPENDSGVGIKGALKKDGYMCGGGGHWG